MSYMLTEMVPTHQNDQYSEHPRKLHRHGRILRILYIVHSGHILRDRSLGLVERGGDIGDVFICRVEGLRD